MKIMNLTPHEITFVGELVDENDNVVDYCQFLTIPASGQVARVKAETVITGEIAGIPTTATKYGEVEGLPAPEHGVIYVVSSLVAQRVPERDDVFIPNESVRDEKGRIIGCKSLGHI